MKFWKYFLLPFALLYGAVLWIRRLTYSLGLLRRNKVSVYTIIVGNMQVGGAGKTPMVIWLADKLRNSHQISVLSRGYGRKTTGFREVTKNESVENCGDEPLEMRSVLYDSVRNFVCEDRVHGIHQIKKVYPETDSVLLDDAFQHLKLKGDFYLLLTDHKMLFTRDLPLPSGRLREFSSAAKDASAIVITKCPENLGTDEKIKIYKEISVYGKPVFFAAYKNSEPVNSKQEVLKNTGGVVLVAGLANNNAFIEWAKAKYQIVSVFTYRDHYAFTQKDENNWADELAKTGATALLTTRKDSMRFSEIIKNKLPVYTTYTTPEFLFNGDTEILDLLDNSIKH